MVVEVERGGSGVRGRVEEEGGQEEGEERGRQGVVRRVDQGLQLLPAPRHHCVAEDQEQVEQDGDRLEGGREGGGGGGERVTTRFKHVLVRV